MNLVSIIIPTYNRPDYLDRLLKSIKMQTFKNFEVIIIDDSSPQKSGYRKVIENYSRSITICYYRNNINRGAQYCRNRGISLSKCKYIAFVDDDDEWLPNKLEKQIILFESKSKNVALIYSWANTINQNNEIIFKYRKIFKKDNLMALLDSCFIPSPTVMIKREIFESVGGFDERLPSCQDWDMWTRIVEYGFEYDLVEEVLALHHKHNRISLGKSPNSLYGFYLYYEKHTPYYLNLGMNKNLSEKYRALSFGFLQNKKYNFARISLKRSLKLWKFNYKSWYRLSQLILKDKGNL